MEEGNMQEILRSNSCSQFSQKIIFAVLLFLLHIIIFSPSWADNGIEDLFAIKAGRIITVTQDTISNGIIIIKNGIIQAVGKDIPIPVGAEMISADTMTVYPGLIDAHANIALPAPKRAEPTESSEGRLSRNQPSQVSTALNPEKMAADMLNPKDSKIEKIREIGVTTALTIADQGIFIGQSALINLAGEQPEDMILKSPVAMHFGYSRQRGVYPSTLMAVIAYQRQTFFDAQHHKLLWERYELQKRGWKRPVPNKSLEALIPVLDGKMPVIISANTENEIKRAMRLANEFNLNYMISGAVEGWRVLDLLKSIGKPVLVSIDFPKPESVIGYSYKLKVEGPSKEKEKPNVQKNKEKGKEKDKKKEEDKDMAEIYDNASALYRSGLKFAFASGGLKKPSDFLKNVAKTVEHGLPKEEALKALTIYPAQFFGVADQIGSIEDGKIANLVVATGDIFNEKTKIKYVFIDGKKFEFEIKEKEKTKEEETTIDVNGTWNLKVDSPDGVVNATLILRQSGSTLSGELKTDFGNASIEEGSISGNKMQFSVTLPIGGKPMELVFEGTVEGDSAEGIIDLGEMGIANWAGTKPGNWSALF